MEIERFVLGNYRKLVHASSLFIPVLVEVTSKQFVVISLSAITILYVLSETLRLKGKHLPLITEFTLRMSPPHESDNFISSPVYLALGTLLALLLFPNKIAYASIAIVAVGDPVASFVGGRFGRRYVRGKTLEGFTGGMLLSFLAALFFVPPATALVGSGIAMVLEVIGILDDNLTMPIGAGFSMMAVSLL